MRRNWPRYFIFSVLFLFLALLGGVFFYWLTSQPLFRAPAAQARTVSWSTLPTPTITQPNWTSYSNSESVNVLLQLDGLIWIGTDGGLIAQDAVTGDQVQFLSEHGVAGNRILALAEGVDGSLWVGSASGGVSNFNGRIWQSYTTLDGLSSDNVRDLAVTADGAVWVATDKGLNRYDGRRWTQFNALNTLFGLSTTNTRAVTAVARSNRVYVATSDGLAFFDGRGWEQYRLTSGTLGSDNVFDVDVAQDGTVWVAHQAGVERLVNGRSTQYGQSDGLLTPEMGWVQAVSVNELYFGYADGSLGVGHLLIESGFVTVRHLDTAVNLPNAASRDILLGSQRTIATAAGLFVEENGGWEKRPLPATIPTHAINSLVAGRGTVWTASEYGVGRFDGSDWQQFTEADGLESNTVTQLAIGPNETPYATFGVAGMGMSRFQSDGSWQPLTCPIQAPQSMQIYDSFEDKDGGFWFATNRGVSHFDQTEWEIFTPFHGLPDGGVWQIDQAPDGTMWAATQFGFSYYDGSYWQTIPVENAQQVAVSSTGTVWGLSAEEVFRIEGETAVSISAIPAQAVGTIDASADALWLATADGVARLDSETLDWFTYTVGEGLPFNRTPVVIVDEQERVWALSESGTIQPSNGFFTPYNFNLRYVSQLVGDTWQPTLIADKNQPIHGIVTDILDAPNGDIWVGTLAGVSRYDGNGWQSYTLANGIPAPEIFDMAYAYGSVWTATQNGVVQLVPHVRDDLIATNRLGWNGEAFLRLQLETAPDGTLWASNGLSFYQFAGESWEEFALSDPSGGIRVDSFTFDENGRLWAAAFDNSNDREQQLYLGVHDGDENWFWQPVTTDDVMPNSFQGLHFAPNGRLWARSTNGVWVFDVNQSEFGQAIERYFSPLIQISDIAFKPDGTPLLTHRLENELYQIEDGQIVSLPLPVYEEQGAHAVTVAQDGTLWVGTNQGVLQLADSNWETHPAVPFQIQGTSNWLTVVGEDVYWLGTFEGQTMGYQNGALIELPLYTDLRTDERRYAITGIFPQAADDIWISSLEGGVARFDGTEWQRLGSSASLYDGVVQALTFAGDTAWIGTSDGLVSRDLAADAPCEKVPNLLWEDTQAAVTAMDQTLWFLGSRVVYALENGEFKRGGYQAWPAVAASSDGFVWFATVEGVMRHADVRMRQMIAELPTETAVNTLAADQNDTLWLGAGDGVHIFAQEEWQRWSSRDGLADNVVHAIAFAPDGSIWFATEGGLSRYQP